LEPVESYRDEDRAKKAGDTADTARMMGSALCASSWLIAGKFSKVILAICYQKNANPPTSITYGKVST
jgi:hypothetical protein